MTTPASWQDTYLQALQDRDKSEQASYGKLESTYIDSYTALLDEVAHLKAQLALNSDDPSNKRALSADSERNKPRNSPLPAGKSATTAQADPNVEKQLRLELAEALRANTQLASRHKVAEAELAQLRARTKNDGKRIDLLKRANATLERKLGDMVDELKGKTRGYGDVQDEMISLNLQLNMAEQKAKKLAAENKELIDRWMKRKEQEVDAMNEQLR